MRPREHFLLFLDECPLKCVYCNLGKERDIYNPKHFNLEQILKIVEKLRNAPDFHLYQNILLFTGGEPFLRWEDIKTVMKKYGNDFIYKFNTCGYLLTEEILEFLSSYNVDFSLSIDGFEEITSVARPLAFPEGENYYSRMKKVFPYLLYYYPTISWKTIVLEKFINKIYEIYCEAEEQGFQKIHFIMDFHVTDLNEKDLEILKEEFTKILLHMIVRFESGHIPLEVDGIESFIKNALKKKDEEFSVNSFICKLFNGRTSHSVYDKGNISSATHCFAEEFPDIQVLEKLVIAEYKTLEGKCPKDENCAFFWNCVQKNCIKISHSETGKFFNFGNNECFLEKLYCQTGLLLMHYGNVNFANNPAWLKYLKEKR